MNVWWKLCTLIKTAYKNIYILYEEIHTKVLVNFHKHLKKYQIAVKCDLVVKSDVMVKLL